jgi:hypothetical protein
MDFPALAAPLPQPPLKDPPLEGAGLLGAGLAEQARRAMGNPGTVTLPWDFK